MTLNNQSVNLFENTVYFVAEQYNGELTPVCLLSFLPLSLSLINDLMYKMCDDIAVIEDNSKEFVNFIFPALIDNPEKKFTSQNQCIACSKEKKQQKRPYCYQCWKSFCKDISLLAESSGWPVEAIYDHEIIYLASQTRRGICAAELAGKSTLTTSRMRSKLDALSLKRFCMSEFNYESSLIEYFFPEVDYSREFYLSNINFIRHFPSSMKEEMEYKFVKIIIFLCIIGLLPVFGQFIFRIPFHLSALIAAFAGIVGSVYIWRKRKNLND